MTWKNSVFGTLSRSGTLGPETISGNWKSIKNDETMFFISP